MKIKRISDEDFITISSLKNTIVRAAISGKKPELVGFNKKGNLINVKFKKNMCVLFKLNENFTLEFDNRVKSVLSKFDIYNIIKASEIGYVEKENKEANPIIKASYCTYDSEYTNTKENSFIVDFEIILSALAFTMFNKDIIPIRAINKNTGEINNLFDVLKPFGDILNYKNNKKLISIRYDL